MKIKTRLVSATMAVAVVAGLLTFLNEYAVAQMTDAQSAATGPAAAQPWRARGMLMPRLRQLAGQLQLTDAQRQAIRQVVADARTAARAQGVPAGVNPQALWIPGDPGHAAAVELAKQRAASRVQASVDTEARIYALLTPEQQARLPQLLGEIRRGRG